MPIELPADAAGVDCGTLVMAEPLLSGAEAVGTSCSESAAGAAVEAGADASPVDRTAGGVTLLADGCGALLAAGFIEVWKSETDLRTTVAALVREGSSSGGAPEVAAGTVSA
jgi:hypothetical protein